MSSSYDHFHTGNNGYHPLTDVANQRATHGLDFVFDFKDFRVFFITNGDLESF